jgi:hypothetical protein
LYIKSESKIDSAAISLPPALTLIKFLNLSDFNFSSNPSFFLIAATTLLFLTFSQNAFISSAAFDKTSLIPSLIQLMIC